MPQCSSVSLTSSPNSTNGQPLQVQNMVGRDWSERLPLAKQIIPLRRNFGKLGCMRWACMVLISNFTPKGSHASAEVGDLVCNFALSFLSALEGAERLYLCRWECFLTDAEYYRPSEATGKQTPVNHNNSSSNNNGRQGGYARGKVQAYWEGLSCSFFLEVSCSVL